MRSLNPRVLRTLRVADDVLKLFDVVVAVCIALNDPSDSRRWDVRLEEYFNDHFTDVDPGEIVRLGEALSDEHLLESVTRWRSRIRGGSYTAFAKRLLGAANYHVLEQAFKEDMAVVGLAVHRAVRALLPYCVAWEDALGAMTPEQLRAATAFDVASIRASTALIKLDQLVGDKLLPGIPSELQLNLADDARRTFEVEDLAEIVSTFRALVSEQSAASVSSLNIYLARKLRGARHALQYSDDGISQAANSLIELIDRLLREDAGCEKVLSWIDENLPGHRDLAWVDKQGDRRPTKLAEALCLVYGGGTVRRDPTEYDNGEDPTLIHMLTARAIVAARRRLQQLKHADGDEELERAVLEQLLSSVEGALMIALRLGSSLDPASSGAAAQKSA